MNRETTSAIVQSAAPDCDALWRKAVEADASAGRVGPGEGARAALLHTVESEVIPRLLMMQGTAPIDLADARSRRIVLGDREVESFAAKVLAGPDDATAHAATLLAAGLSRERLFLDLLGPAARHLGELWVADRVGFTDVTLGLWRLQRLLDIHAGALRAEPGQRAAQPRSALLAAAPGEQHTFGVAMAIEFFRQAGWRLPADRPADARAVVEHLSRRRVDLLGLSIGGERHLDAARALIRRCREVSANRRLAVIVGGPYAAVEPALARQLGADGAAADVGQAILLAESLLTDRESDR